MEHHKDTDENIPNRILNDYIKQEKYINIIKI